MKCLPAFSTDSLRSSSSVWASFVGLGLSFSPQYPKEHMVIKTINAAFLRPFFFYWLLIMIIGFTRKCTHAHRVLISMLALK